MLPRDNRLRWALHLLGPLPLLLLLASSAWAQTLVDLNTASESELDSLPGIGPVKAQAILAYREEHGSFRHPTELMQVTGIGRATYQGLCQQIVAEGIHGCDAHGVIPQAPDYIALPSVESDGRININLATAQELEILPRIGETLASRIVAYRDSNGPFTDVSQLEQVDGIGPTTLAEITAFVTIQTDLNTVTAEELETLGVSTDLAAEIVSRRRVNGDYDSVTDLADVDGMTTALLDRLRVLLIVGL